MDTDDSGNDDKECHITGIEECKALARELQSDRLIEIHVGTDPRSKPYRVQQKLLEGISDYFLKALSEDRFKEGREGQIRLTDDNVASWEVFLYWLLHRRLPQRLRHPDLQQSDDLLMIHCWVFGDKYAIPKFQDEAMFALLYLYQTDYAPIAHIKKGIAISGLSSKVCKLMVEEIIYLLHRGCSEHQCTMHSFEKVTEFDGLGVIGEIMQAHSVWGPQGGVCKIVASNRGSQRRRKEENAWREFMVAEWPEGHHLLI